MASLVGSVAFWWDSVAFRWDWGGFWWDSPWDTGPRDCAENNRQVWVRAEIFCFSPRMVTAGGSAEGQVFRHMYGRECRSLPFAVPNEPLLPVAVRNRFWVNGHRHLPTVWGMVFGLEVGFIDSAVNKG